MTGALLPNLFPSQVLDEIIKIPNIYLFVKDDIFFFENQNIPIFSINNVHDFIGDLLVFDLDSAEVAINILSQIKIHFFVRNLEWLQGKTNFLQNIKIYNSVDYLYSAEDHYYPILNYCNRKPTIIKSEICCEYQ